MSLSIVVLNYNGKEFLPRCLDAVFSQGLPSDREVLLIDNSSTDKSEVEAHNTFPIDSLIRGDNKHQFITGLNLAFKHAKYENVLFVTNDVIMQPWSIHKLYSLIIKVPKSLIQPVFYTEAKKIQNAGMEYHWPGYGLAETFVSDGPYYSTDIVTTTAFIMNKSAFKEIGPFDVNFAPGGYEDVDYSLRAKALGYERLVAGSAIATHLTSKSFTPVYGKRGISDICYKNRTYLIDKYYSGLDRWLRQTVNHAVRSIHTLSNGKSNSLKAGSS